MVQKRTTKVYQFISRKLIRRGLIQPRPGRSLRMLTLPFLWTMRANRLPAIASTCATTQLQNRIVLYFSTLFYSGVVQTFADKKTKQKLSFLCLYGIGFYIYKQKKRNNSNQFFKNPDI
jgi:hypothetical protein